MMKDFSDYIKERFDDICPPKPFDNIVIDTIYDNKTSSYYSFFNEGLIWSYDPQFTIRHICAAVPQLGEDDFKIIDIYPDYVKNDFNLEHKMLKNNKGQYQYIRCRLYNDSKLKLDDLNNIFKACGYFWCKKREHDNYVSHYYYPKFQEEINKKVRSQNKYLYHYTFKDFKRRIKKYGLVPKENENDTYKYPSRIFFLKENCDDATKRWFVEKLIEKKERKNKDMIEIKVDLSKVDKRISFFTDPDYESFAYFCYENISPKAIEIRDYDL